MFAEIVELGMPGVRLHRLRMHQDGRGKFTELFRQAEGPFSAVQWSLVDSRRDVVRGLKLHHRHSDYVVAVAGRLFTALVDLRLESAAYGAWLGLETSGTALEAIEIPPGVAHGFAHPEEGLMLVGVSHYYDLADELGCRYDDPTIGIEWPFADPILSPRDAALPSRAELERKLAACRGVRAPRAA